MITQKFFSSKQQYITFRKAFSVKGQIKPIHHMVLNLVRGLPFDRGFTPITNKTKLDNGMRPHHSRKFTHYELCDVIADAKFLLSITPAEKIEQPKKGILGFFKKVDPYKQLVSKHTEQYTKWKEERAKKRTGELIASFNHALTLEDLAKLSLPKLDWYGNIVDEIK